MAKDHHDDEAQKHSKEHKERKEKKQKKEHKDKEHRKEKKDQHGEENQEKRQQISGQVVSVKPSYEVHQSQRQEPSEYFEEKTHVSCRRCKNITFSLKKRTCSQCGYPKEERPAFFPVTKEVHVLDLVREGKLTHNSFNPMLIEVVVNDRMGKRQRIKCHPDDSMLDFKKLISAQIGTRPDKIRLQKANIIYKDHLSLADYEIKDGMGLEMYYD